MRNNIDILLAELEKYFSYNLYAHIQGKIEREFPEPLQEVYIAQLNQIKCEYESEDLCQNINVETLHGRIWKDIEGRLK